ncbi:SLBB domain-containing protein [Sphingomonas azotifigens]|uniref:SLBB domain-containing protein n=1 Tax=Sphingomonas azotifigens TaxID=330920 RepID=UPI0009FDC427|nr:SLBB domain-containing protein [Sphingomonas azotifigens]
MTLRYVSVTAGVALALVAAPASAQLASPVGGAARAGIGAEGSSPRATPGIAVPEATPTPFAPARIDQPQPDPVPASAAASPTPPPASAVPPSAFESFVSGVAGKPLRRFGAELLVPEARDFTVPATTAIPPDYRIAPGDQLRLDLAGSVQGAGLRLTVDGEGRIFVPQVGAIQVGGVRYGDLRDVIAARVSRQYRGFTLEVSVVRLHGLRIYVTGFARRPGAYTVTSIATLVNAALAAGGPAEGGSFRSIQLRRGGELVSDLDLYDLLLRGDKRGDASLRDGDVIHIAPAGPQVAVIGSVNREAIFEVAPGETLADAVAYAGGASTVADTGRLLVLDSLGQGNGGWQQLSAADARSRVVRRGDVVQVLSNVGVAHPIAQQPVLVTLSGEVAHPGRYYVQPGTRLADVIAQAGGLTREAFPYASVITRESVKAQQRESFARAVDDMELQLSTQPLVSANRAQLATSANLQLLDQVVAKMHAREPSGRLVFDLPVDARALPADLLLENNDTIHVPTRPVTIGVFGAVASPASFAYRDGQTIGDAVRSAGGVQSLGHRKEIFVVRANGTVLAEGTRTLRAPALPGDLIFVPIDANRGAFWARLRDITGSLFGGVVGAATVVNAVR